MSPRAAWRLEGLGFERVYDYVPGKADWFASGLPMEGKMASVPVIRDAARRDVPTCAPTEKLGVVRERLRKAGWDRCVVVNEERVSCSADYCVRMSWRRTPRRPSKRS
jgi:hypothetical protein